MSAAQQTQAIDQQRYSFTGHQTFSFRFAWLPKGIMAIKQDPGIFFREDALVSLGVGKNMVDSIRFWCEAMALATVDGRQHEAHLEPLGKLLFGRNKNSNGADPYLEYPGTLWLLHWQLASRPELASTWYLAFTRWGRNMFTRDQLVKWVLQIAEHTGGARSSLSSIKRDVDVFLRTYIPAEEDRRRPIEETFDCPLGELGLIRRLEDGFFQFSLGPKPSLPIEIFAYALVDYWRSNAATQDTINLERVLYDPGSPGAAFKLNDKSIVALAEQLPESSGIRYDETAGLRVLIRTQEAFADPIALLKEYYDSN